MHLCIAHLSAVAFIITPGAGVGYGNNYIKEQSIQYEKLLCETEWNIKIYGTICDNVKKSTDHS